MLIKILFSVGVVALAAWAGSIGAGAQYPADPDDVLLAAGNPNPQIGGTTSVAASLRDASGAPIAGVDCSFEIASQPGSGASLDSETATTNEDGVANVSLNVGDTPGTIVIEATCGGVLNTLSVSVAGGSSGVPAQPPASLPGTGAHPQARGHLPTFAIGTLAFAAFVLFAGAGYVLNGRRR